MTIACRYVLLGLLLFGLPGASAAQLTDVSTGRIYGKVTEEGVDAGLAGVEVSVLGESEARTLSDGRGYFAFRDLEPGVVEVRFERLGYEPRTVQVVVQPGRSVDLFATMTTRPIELEGIEVRVRPRLMELNGFYARSVLGFGHQFSRRDIEELGPTRMSNVVSRVPGVDVRRSGPGQTSAFSRRSTTGCRLMVHLDGIRMAAGWSLDTIHPDQIEAIEVYHGVATPIQFTGEGCGVVLIWTRS